MEQVTDIKLMCLAIDSCTSSVDMAANDVILDVCDSEAH